MTPEFRRGGDAAIRERSCMECQQGHCFFCERMEYYWDFGGYISLCAYCACYDTYRADRHLFYVDEKSEAP